MSEKSAGETILFAPTQAFVYALDRAVTVTADCLRKAGVDEETIWKAMEKSLAITARAIAEIDQATTENAPSAAPASSVRVPRSSRPRSLPDVAFSGQYH